MANARKGTIQFPPALAAYCEAVGWTLFRVALPDSNRLDLIPVLAGDASDPEDDYHSSLSSDGVLWIPTALRDRAALKEQSVMMRVESGIVVVYLRKVFETLGFRP